MSSVTSSSSLSSVVSRFKSKTVNLAGAAHIGITGSRVYAIEVFCLNFKQVYATGRGVLGSAFSHHPSMYAKLSFEIIPWASHIGASLQMFFLYIVRDRPPISNTNWLLHAPTNAGSSVCCDDDSSLGFKIKSYRLKGPKADQDYSCLIPCLLCMFFC